MMTDEASDAGSEVLGDSAVANVHALTVNLAAMKRLLGRRTGEGALVQADPVLIRSAIDVGRAEVRRIRTILADLPPAPTNPWRPSVDKLIVAASDLDGLLDTLDDMLPHASD